MAIGRLKRGFACLVAAMGRAPPRASWVDSTGLVSLSSTSQGWPQTARYLSTHGQGQQVRRRLPDQNPDPLNLPEPLATPLCLLHSSHARHLPPFRCKLHSQPFARPQVPKSTSTLRHRKVEKSIEGARVNFEDNDLNSTVCPRARASHTLHLKTPALYP